MGRRRSSDPAFLWLWRRPAATAPIRPLAWEPPHATGAAQEMVKRQKKKERKKHLEVFNMKDKEHNQLESWTRQGMGKAGRYVHNI